MLKQEFLEKCRRAPDQDTEDQLMTQILEVKANDNLEILAAVAHAPDIAVIIRMAAIDMYAKLREKAARPFLEDLVAHNQEREEVLSVALQWLAEQTDDAADEAVTASVPVKTLGAVKRPPLDWREIALRNPSPRVRYLGRLSV